MTTHHRTAEVDGHRIFYREAGDEDAPTIVLLHGYSLDALAAITAGLLEQLGVRRHAIYVQDHGAPVGWRLLLDHPGEVAAVVTRNGNAYEDGFVEELWAPIRDYARRRDRAAETAPVT